jgi:hypothetical protein
MAQMMLKPSGQLVKKYRIPRSVMREAYTRNPAHRAESLASMRRVRKLCDDMGGYQRAWRALHLAEESRPG